MNYFKRNITFLALLAISILLLTACNDNKNGEDKGNSITMEDAYGKVSIPASPEKIVAPNLEDSLIALGEKPAGQWSIGTTVYNYLQDNLKDVPKIEWNMPIEQIIKVEPDLIIFNGKISVPDGRISNYKNVAPTFVLKDEDSFNWRNQLNVIGKMLGKEDKAKEFISNYEKESAAATKDIKASIGDQSVAMIWIVDGKFFVFEQDRYAGNVVYKDLGLTVPTFLKDLPPAEVTWVDTSLEALANLDADHIFTIGLNDDPGFEILANSPLWQNLKATQANQVYQLDDTSPWTVNGAIASETVIGLLKEKLIK